MSEAVQFGLLPAPVPQGGAGTAEGLEQGWEGLFKAFLAKNVKASQGPFLALFSQAGRRAGGSTSQSGEGPGAQTAGKSQKQGTTQGEASLVVPDIKIPLVQEVLFKLGLGAGEVKSITEKSGGGGAGLDLQSLARTLDGTLGEAVSEEDVDLLLQRFGIKAGSGSLSEALGAQGLQDALRAYAQAASLPAQQAIKREIAVLLREKGIPPQEVKSFVETLSPNRAKALIHENAAKAEGSTKEETEGPGKTASRIAFDPRPKRDSRGGQDNLMPVFREGEDRTSKIKEASAAAGVHDKGTARPVPDGVLGERAQGPGDKPLAAAVSVKAGRHPAEEGALSAGGPSLKGRSGEIGEKVQIKEAPETPPAVTRPDRAVFEVAATPRARNSAELPYPLPKVLDRMVWMTRNGEQMGRIAISPPELGRLDIEVLLKNGHLQANLSAETPLVKEIIEANLGHLKQQLTDQGLVVERFDVSLGLDNRRFQEGGERHRARSRGRAPESAEASVGAVPEVGARGDEGSGPSRISIHV